MYGEGSNPWGHQVVNTRLRVRILHPEIHFLFAGYWGDADFTKVSLGYHNLILNLPINDMGRIME